MLAVLSRSCLSHSDIVAHLRSSPSTPLLPDQPPASRAALETSSHAEMLLYGIRRLGRAGAHTLWWALLPMRWYLAPALPAPWQRLAQRKSSDRHDNVLSNRPCMSPHRCPSRGLLKAKTAPPINLRTQVPLLPALMVRDRSCLSATLVHSHSPTLAGGTARTVPRTMLEGLSSSFDDTFSCSHTQDTGQLGRARPDHDMTPTRSQA